MTRRDVRSVLVDGSPAARPPGPVADILPGDDPSNALVVVCERGRATELWRWSIDDGALELVVGGVPADGFVVARRAERFFAAVRAGRSSTIEWYDAHGAGVVLESERYLGTPWGCDPSGRFVWFESDDNRRDPTRDRHTFSVVRVEDGRTVARIEAHEPGVFTDDGRHFAAVADRGATLALASTDDGAVRRVPLDADLTPRAIFAERGGPRVVLWADPGTLVVCDPATERLTTWSGLDGRATVVDVAAGSALLREPGGRGPSCALRSLDDGTVRPLPGEGITPRLAAAGARMLRYRRPVLEAIEVDSGRPLRRHDGHDGTASALAWSNDGVLLASLASDGVVRVWDVPGAALVWELEFTPTPASAIAFAPDRPLLFAAGPAALVAWDLASGIEVARHAGPERNAKALAFSPDGTHLLAAGEGGFRLLADPAGRPREVARGYMPDVRDVAFTGPGGFRCLGETAGVSARSDEWRRTDDLVRWCDLQGRTLLKAQWLHPRRSALVPVADDVHAGVVLRERRALRVDLRDPGSASPLAPGAAFEDVLDARAGRVALLAATRGRHGITATSLVVLALADGAELARVTSARRPRLAMLAPDGAHVAVAYADGGVEVFALPGATGRAP